MAVLVALTRRSDQLSLIRSTVGPRAPEALIDSEPAALREVVHGDTDVEYAVMGLGLHT